MRPAPAGGRGGRGGGGGPPAAGAWGGGGGGREVGVFVGGFMNDNALHEIIALGADVPGINVPGYGVGSYRADGTDQHDAA
ncbi:hypothetical protein [Nocardia brasiliensis]|uniref:hypothetical protein n=1 Tax=Nocardia brasiliensis TaxID=37326 RepID=UPI002455A359|nr:hypothetical protein [Nocardia brasiliensis]